MIREKLPAAWRHELKYSINSMDDYLLCSRLRKLFRHDRNADENGVYLVNSLYFDTPYDKALRQKMDGVNSREKFRIRYYNGNTSFIRLEKKVKHNGLCAKYSAKLSEMETEQILRGEIAFLLESGNPLLMELYGKMKGQLLKPVTIVRYEREAFLYEPGNVRVTVDRKLQTGLWNTDFLNQSKYGADVSDGLAVLEVKYDEFLPDIVRMAVQTPDRRVTAFSKYAVCRKYD